MAAIALAFWVIFTGVFGMIRACGEPLAAELLVEPGANVNGIEREGMTHLNWMTICNKERGIQTLRTLGGLLCDELDRNNDR